MKIAKEIREMLESMGVIQHGLLDQEYDTQRIDERIAAKLEPVRKAIARAYVAEDTRDMWLDVGVALAMLSEEE